MNRSKFTLLVVLLLLAWVVTACNLNSAPEEEIDITAFPTNTISSQPTRTTVGVPTTVSVTALPGLTLLPPTAVVILPSTQPLATSTPSTTSIFIVSPIPGSIVAGNVQILGSAIHPNFLQYQLEFGPDPNPGNLWYPIGGARLSPVLNNLLGIWSTTAGNVPDGVYQLRLRVFLRDGSNPQTVVNNIRVQNQAPTPQPSPTQSIPRPIAAFSYNPRVGLAPLSVTFTNQSSGNISSYTWDFGDGSTANERNPVHTFRRPGTYDVKLTVSGPGGSSNVASRVQVNAGDPPVAAFTEDKVSGTAPLTVKFTNSSTGNIRRYIWDFGDGTTSGDVNPSHTYTNQGTYNVILEVRGPAGSDQEVHTITVVNPTIPAPVAAFSPTNITINLNEGIQFTNQSTGRIDRYLWEFGDGTVSTDQNPRKLYTTAGTYTVKLSVSGEGGQSSATGTVIVNQPAQAPTAKFSANPTNGNAPLTVQFTDESTGEVTGYSWNFGGAGNSTDRNPSFRFENPGTYTVVLTVTGRDNTSGTASMDISVTEPLAAPDANFTANPTNGSAPLNVTFTNQSSGDELTYRWDFGDGSTSDSAEAIIQHTYQTNGTYTARLTVSGPGGPNSTFEVPITVTDALSAAFEAFPLQNPLQYQFNDQSTGTVTGWRWNFGDGGESTDQNPQHTYAQAGTYTARLTVTDGAGGTNTVEKPITVTQPVTPATAAFSAQPTLGNAPLQVTFTNNSTGDIASYLWDFGDGNTSTEANPAPYTFTVPNTYTVTLTVTGDDGALSSDSEQITVSAAPVPPTAGFNAAPDPNNPLRIQFTSTSTGEVWGYYWEFGDGSSSEEQNPAHTYTQGGTYTVLLRVFGPNDSQDDETQQVNVQQPTQPATAAFTASPQSGDAPLTVTFTNNSTGDITGYLWNFGDNNTSTEANPAPYTFTVPNTYTITLSVTGADGGTSQASQTITVNVAPVAAPVADFEFAVDLANPLAVQFTNASSGDITGYAWDFGDGNGSTEQNPFHTYAEGNSYTVTLTVNGAGGSNSATQTVEVTAPVADAPTETPDPATSIANTTEIQPDVAAVGNNIRGILSSGVNNGTARADVFSLVGDGSITPNFLTPFDDLTSYRLGSAIEADIADTITFYNGGEVNSFARLGEAPRGTVSELLAGSTVCANVSVLACELQTAKPGVLVISSGYREARDVDVNAPNLDTFRTNLREIVQTTIDNGTIPVLLTVHARPGDDATKYRLINEVIIEVADEFEVPVVNIWRLFRELGDQAYNGDVPSAAPDENGVTGAGILTGNTLSTYGENARNYHVLKALDQIRGYFP